MNVKAPYRISGFQFPSSSDARAICAALSRVATGHAEDLQIMNGFDPGRDCGWVILSIRLRVLQLPAPLETVDLETWVSAAEGATLVREYSITADASATATSRGPLIEAAQSFVLFDRDTRRPVVPPSEKRELLKGLERRYAFSVDINRRTSFDDYETLVPTLETSHVVTADEVDYNGHLNHAEYLKWLTDHIGPLAPGCELAVEYIREARLGDLLNIRSWREGETTTIAFKDITTGITSAIVRHLRTSRFT